MLHVMDDSSDGRAYIWVAAGTLDFGLPCFSSFKIYPFCCIQVVTTISQGKVVWDNGKVSVEPGSGRFISIQPFAPHVYDGMKRQEELWIQEDFPYGPTPVKRKGDKATLQREEL